MGVPIACVTDVTNHGGTIVGPGAPTVLVGGKPVALMGDMHICAIPYPHPMVSAFPMGSATVLIGGKPVLRITDACICGAMAAVGQPTVLVG